LKHTNIATPFAPASILRPTTAAELYRALANNQQWEVKGYALDEINLYFVIPDPDLFGDPEVSRDLLGTKKFVKLGKSFQFSDLARHEVIRPFAAQYAGGLPNNARIVVVLPAPSTTADAAAAGIPGHPAGTSGRPAAAGGPGMPVDAAGGAGDATAVLQAINNLTLAVREGFLAQDMKREDERRRDRARQLAYQPRSLVTDKAMRSPEPAERLPLKRKVIDYYGLKTAGGKVFTMVGPKEGEATEQQPELREPVDMEQAILAHVYPSSKARTREAEMMREDFHLPRGFEAESRNFLILPKELEESFDAGAVVILPTKKDPPTAVIRVFDISRAKNRDVAKYDGRTLYLPRAAAGKVPYFRLLAWRAVSVLRENDELQWDMDLTITPDLPRDILSRYAGILYRPAPRREEPIREDQESVPEDEESDEEDEESG
jgi:hypothetical protein